MNAIEWSSRSIRYFFVTFFEFEAGARKKLYTIKKSLEFMEYSITKYG